MRAWIGLIAVMALTAPAVATPAGGTLVERVTCRGAAGEEYAFYLPSRYDASSKWPIVYALDARGHALEALDPFRAAADLLGFIIASSWNSASDGPIQPNVDALRAMWNDTHASLSIDDRQVYVAGYSGTARSAVLLAKAVPGSVTGIIAAGAGYPDQVKPAANDPFVFFGTVGTRDFNFAEMQQLEERMTSVNLPHRIRRFQGEHAWMPADLAAEALSWMQLRAMKSGARAVDAAFIERNWSADLARAAAADPVEAVRIYQSMGRDYHGLRDTAPAVAKEKELRGSRAYRDASRELSLALREEGDYVEQAMRILATARSPESAAKSLRVEELRARKDDAATRMLNTLRAQTAFYLPREMSARHDYARAAFYLGVASRIAPENPFIAYNLAAAQARGGQRDEALATLRKAIQLGFDDHARLDADEAFASVRQHPDFKDAVALMK